MWTRCGLGILRRRVSKWKSVRRMFGKKFAFPSTARLEGPMNQKIREMLALETPSALRMSRKPCQRPHGVHQRPYDRTISPSVLAQKVHRECRSFTPISIPAPPSPFLTGHSRQRTVTFWGRDTYQQSDTWNSHRNAAGV